MIDLKPACEQLTELLAGITDEQLDRPTPCAEYAVRDLVAHVDEAAWGFASLAREEDDQPVPPLGADWRDVVSEHARDLGVAWGDAAAWEGRTPAAGVELTNAQWGRIALTEVVVHGWDLAQATGQPFDLPEPTLRACLEHVEEFVPEAPIPELWGTAVDVPADAPLLDRIVAITGRRP
ncbi:TIGR03086 family metal-binding protein [Saccharopolyspora sp. NPDC002686]|uniref:TIGR03086 family metal-binding protein n=1 Tax=Saccharopolyspora sp. NPDC002686 TaxID=3154541 RepID=UPI003324C4D7